jgi:hypothetical protein
MGELSFCINDLPGFRSAREEVAHEVVPNYRGATSESMPIEKVI